MSVDPDLAVVIELEQRLLAPEVRVDGDELRSLLDADFREFGASGRVYDRDSIIEALLGSDGYAAEASDFRATRLGTNAVLLTYRTATSLRPSVWRRDHDEHWRVLHHQGTPTSPTSPVLFTP